MDGSGMQWGGEEGGSYKYLSITHNIPVTAARVPFFKAQEEGEAHLSTRLCDLAAPA